MTKYLIIIVVPSLIVLVLICIIIVLALIAACFVTHYRRHRPGGNVGVERINFADEVPPVYN